jgi:hypothetical protein
MKAKLIHSIAGLALALGLNVASAGPAPEVQGLADGKASSRPFSAVLGSADYVPMSNRELSKVNGKQLGGLVQTVGGLLPAPVGPLLVTVGGLLP